MKTYSKIISIILALIAAGCLLAAGILLATNNLQYKQSAQTVETLRPPETPAPNNEAADLETSESSSQVESVEAATASPLPTVMPTPTPAPTPSAIENPYKEAYLSNNDMAAWIQIPDTNIDYPVMWTPRDENYYLYRDFDGSNNQNGCLILDTDSSLTPLTTNLIIHGHNMRSGAMFGNLTDYESEDFYQNHKQIILHTEECKRNYEVIAVFRSQVFKKSDQVFKFYKFFQADTQEEFDDFYQNIKAMSLYDTGVTAEYGDRFLTLSTCVYHVEQGRFVVVAKEVESGDQYLPIQE